MCMMQSGISFCSFCPPPNRWKLSQMDRTQKRDYPHPQWTSLRPCQPKWLDKFPAKCVSAKSIVGPIINHQTIPSNDIPSCLRHQLCSCMNISIQGRSFWINHSDIWRWSDFWQIGGSGANRSRADVACWAFLTIIKRYQPSSTLMDHSCNT